MRRANRRLQNLITLTKKMIIESKGKLGYSAKISTGERFAGFTRMEAITKALEFISGNKELSNRYW